jgi:hypothetical protein
MPLFSHKRIWPIRVSAAADRVLGVSVSGYAARYCRSEGRFRQFRPVDQGLACEDSRRLHEAASARIPAYTRHIPHTDSWGFGLIRLSPALGALTMSVVLARRPIRRHAGMRMFGAVIVVGRATIAFALSRSAAHYGCRCSFLRCSGVPKSSAWSFAPPWCN